MYERHFNLRRRPFRPAPDTAAYYPAGGHESALGRLRDGLLDDEGVVALTGDPGTGKTLLGYRLVEELPGSYRDRFGAEVETVFLPHGPGGGRAGLLQAVLFDLGLPYDGRGEQELRLAVVAELLARFAAGRRTVLLLDEAQALTPDMLDELRQLTNLEAGDGKAVQVVLIGQPGLLRAVNRPRSGGLAQRLVVRVGLGPLGPDEAADYLLHHIRIAGGRPESVLTDEAVEILVRGAGGLPRLLNQAGHEALRLAHAGGARLVDAEAALEALAALRLTDPADSAEETIMPGDRPGPEDEGVEDPGAESDHEPQTPRSRLSVTPKRPA